jgi:hypothetical protein
MKGVRPAASRLRSKPAMVFQAFAVDTLLPPNFMTTQGEPDISRLDPSSLPSAKGASSISMLTTVTCLFRLFIFHINRPIHFAGKKKPAWKIRAGLLLAVLILVISRYYRQFHPRTPGAPFVLWIFRRPTSRRHGTMRGCKSFSRLK